MACKFHNDTSLEGQSLNNILISAQAVLIYNVDLVSTCCSSVEVVFDPVDLIPHFE